MKVTGQQLIKLIRESISEMRDDDVAGAPYPEHFSSGNEKVPDHIWAARLLIEEGERWEKRIKDLTMGYGDADLSKVGFDAAVRTKLIAAIRQTMTKNPNLLAASAEYDKIIAGEKDAFKKQNDPAAWAKEQVRQGRKVGEVAAELGISTEKLRNVLRRKYNMGLR